MTKIGRNDPCHCGSGKKYKQCHGVITSNEEILRAAQAGGFRVSQDFNDRVQLRYIGPVIKGAWRLSPDDQERLTMGGLPIPDPVSGYMLIDTGAAAR